MFERSVTPKNFSCVIGLIYGPHDRPEKSRMWKELSEDCKVLAPPYLMIGGFNEVLRPDDRRSGNVNLSCKEEFANWVDDSNLIDLQLKGRKYTWRRGSSCSRIDRILFLADWDVTFPGLSLRGLKCSRSDHIPLLLESKQINWGRSHLGPWILGSLTLSSKIL